MRKSSVRVSLPETSHPPHPFSSAVQYFTRPTVFNPKARGDLFGDIALIYLDAPSKAQTVAVDNGTYSGSNTPKWYIVAGWGKQIDQKTTPILKWAAIPSISTSLYAQWAKAFKSATGSFPGNPEPDHIVAGLGKDGADSCQGDSGGPLFIPGPPFTNAEASQDILVGVVSYGPSAQCGGSDNIGFYTKVSYWKDWIQATVQQNKWA